MILLDGKTTAQAVTEEIKGEVALLTERIGRPPGLTVVLAGDDPASQIYVRNKERTCTECGIASEVLRFDSDLTQQGLMDTIAELNARDDVDGILVQLPLYSHLIEQDVIEAINPAKDVDGFHPVNMGRLAQGLPGLRPCTPAGVMLLLERYGLDPSGKKAVVVGRSNIVGKPLALLLSSGGPMGNATVTLCHSRTPDLAAECRQADFLFAAVGRPGIITEDMVREGAVVVDVGINRTDDGLKGDCDFEAIKHKAHAMTPVPKGVGPMTIAHLLVNTVAACKARLGIE